MCSHGRLGNRTWFTWGKRGKMKNRNKRAIAGRAVIIASMLVGLFVTVGSTNAGAAPAQCYGYTATTLSVSPATVVAGGGVTLSGKAVPFETVSATLLSSPSASLGSGPVNGSGDFSFGATIPLSTAAGVYTIQGTSTSCSSFVVSVTVTAPPPIVLPLVVTPPPAPETPPVPPAPPAPEPAPAPAPNAFSSCAASEASRAFIPGQSVAWSLETSGFDTSKNVRLKLRNGATLYPLSAWPAGNETSITIPESLASGTYYLEQTGYTSANKITTKSCKITVSSTPAPAAARTASNGISGPFVALFIGALGAAALFQLRIRRVRRSTID